MGIRNGDPRIEDGFARVPNELLEAMAKTSFTDHESRCVHLLWRKTYGWQNRDGQAKKVDRISHSQWSDGTGIPRRHMPRVLDRLIQRNIFIKTNLHEGNKKTILWGFNPRYGDWLTPLFEPQEALPPVEGATRHEVSPAEGAVRHEVSPVRDQLPPVEGAKVPPSEGTTKDNKDIYKRYTTTEETEMLKVLQSLKGWRPEENEDLVWLREFENDYAGVALMDFKACRDYFSGKVAPKNKGPWKNRLRNWMARKPEFMRAPKLLVQGTGGEHGTGYKPPKPEGASKSGRTIDAEGEVGAAD